LQYAQHGIQNVSRKTLAILHEGEAVITKELNPYLGKSMQPAMAGAGNSYTININNPMVRKSEDWDNIVRQDILPAIRRYDRKTT
jgi:hypothetical protein